MILWLVPFIGACVLVALSSLAFEYGRNVLAAPKYAGILTILCWLIAFARNSRQSWLRDLATLRRVPKSWKELILTPVLLLAVILTPSFLAPGPQTPFHIGSDPIGNAIGAKYLMEGGQLAPLRDTIMSATGESDFTNALQHASDLVNFTTFVQADSLLLGRRWGVPFLAAEMTSLTSQNHVFNLLYLLTALLQLGLYFVSFWSLKTLWKVSNLAALSGAAAIVLNCNMLNLSLEGGYAQIFTTPGFLLVWSLWFIEYRTRSLTTRVQTALLIALTMTYTLITYSEFFYVLSALLVGVAAIQVLQLRNVALWERLKIFGLGWVCTGVLAFSYLLYSLRDLPLKAKYAKVGGYFQPQWAMPSEILGFLNIYNLQKEPLHAFEVHSRSGSLLKIAFILSVLLIMFFVARSRTAIIRSRLYWLLPVILTAAVWFKQYVVDKSNNYQYMKAYTYTLPILWIAFWHVLARWSEGNLRRLTAIFALPLWVALVGLHYQASQQPWVTVTSPSLEQLQAFANTHGLADKVILTGNLNSIEELIQDMLIGAYVNMNWANNPLGGSNINWRINKPYLDKEIAYVFYKSRVPCEDCLLKTKQLDKIYSVGDFLVITTKTKLRDGIRLKDGKDWIDMEELMQPFRAAL